MITENLFSSKAQGFEFSIYEIRVIVHSLNVL